MTTNINACPQCGTPLPAEAPEGLCPQCLLKAGLESSLTDLGYLTAAVQAHFYGQPAPSLLPTP